MNPTGLGRAIINRKVKDAKHARDNHLVRVFPAGDLLNLIGRVQYTTDLDSTTKLKSVTQQNDLDEFLNTAQLAGTDFTAGASSCT